MTPDAQVVSPPARPPTSTVEDLGIRVEVPAVPHLVWLALAVGILCDLALRSGVASLGGALLVVGTSIALLASGRLRTRTSQLLVAAAPLFGGWVAFRTSGWLLPLDVLVAFALLVLGTSLSSGGSIFDLSLPNAAQRFAVSVVHGCSVPGFMRPIAAKVAQRAGGDGAAIPVLRGVVLAIPVVIAFGALLASADAVFASIFRLDLDTGDLVLHASLIVLGAWVLLGLLRTASAEPVRPRGEVHVRLGHTEVTVLLGSIVVLFGAFAASQLVALSEGGQRVLDTAGLTYAEYARSGFFQLLWVAALTIALLLGLRAAVEGDPRAHRRFVHLAEAVVALTLAIVVVAIRRLGLYQDAFGLTMLRLYCTVFALWVGAVIVGLGAMIGGVRADRRWLPGAAGVAGLVALFGLNLLNPEALVARHNLDRIAEGREVDADYLAEGLSMDAVPTIVDRLPMLDPAAQDDLRARIGCPTEGQGWAGWNASRSAAVEAVGSDCVESPYGGGWDD